MMHPKSGSLLVKLNYLVVIVTLVFLIVAACPAVEFPNGGWERGAESWDLPPNASMDRNVVKEGNTSLRLDVKKGDTTDVVRYVPVKPGRPYTVRGFVRTKNVRKGYASLVVQWAGKEKVWLGTGGRSKKFKGTNEWQSVEIVPSPSGVAPAGAEYMILFLMLRGEGTAWFDGLEVIPDLPEIPTPLSPAEGEILHDNRPTFRWSMPHIACAYRLEVSTDREFPRRKTLRFSAEGPEFTPDTPLPSGKLYWRVRLKPSRRFSAVSSFTQQADPLDDTTGPTITLDRQYLPQPRDAVIVRIEDPSGVKKDSLRAGIDEQAVKPTVNGNEMRITPRDDWKKLQWITVSASDIKGNVTSRRFPVTHVSVPTKVAFREDGVILKNDAPVFPLGIYQVRGEEAMTAAKKVGFDLVHDYKWSKSDDDEGARAYLDEAHRHGLGVFMEFQRGTKPGARGLVQGNFDKVARRVAALMDHPALFAWYLADEPEKKFIHPMRMRQYRELIHRLDPFHPVTAVIGMYDTSSYAGTMDWHWSESYISTQKVGDDFRGRSAGLSGTPQAALNRTMGAVKNDAGRVNTANDFYRIFRPQAYMAVASGSNALLYWWWSWQPEEMSNPAKKQAMARLLGEIRKLTPVLTAQGKVQHPPTQPEGILHTWRKDFEGRRYLIAVNPTDQQVHARIDVGRGGVAVVLFENRSVNIRHDVIKDVFSADSAHVYCME